MSDSDRHFKGIDFGKEWTEEDWERFFRAQERLMSERQASSKGKGGYSASELSFREVLRRFGIDPDGGRGPAEPLLPAEADAPVLPGSHRAFWEDEAEAESLPLYVESQTYVVTLHRFIRERFRNALRKTFKSPRHRYFQTALKRLRAHALEIPRNVAAGHALGYGPEGIKGNIARLRRALYHADASVGLLSRVNRSFMSREDFRVLFAPAVRMRNALLGWIAFLREHAGP
jgi:hypothetical protein